MYYNLSATALRPKNKMLPQAVQPPCDQNHHFLVTDQSAIIRRQVEHWLATGGRELCIKTCDQSRTGRWLIGDWSPIGSR